MISNNDVAILMKVNELAERYGFKPSDFVATLKPTHDDSLDTILDYECPASGSKEIEQRFYRMTDSVGAETNSGQVRGGKDEIMVALQNAIILAPPVKGRGR